LKAAAHSAAAVARAAAWSFGIAGTLFFLAAVALILYTVAAAEPACWTGACHGLSKNLFDAGWQVSLVAAGIAAGLLLVAFLLARGKSTA
jgi:hypothetical protein